MVETADIIKLDQVLPLNCGTVAASCKKTGRILIVEEAAENGSVGQALLADFLQQGLHPASRLLNCGSGIVTHGDLKSLRHSLGIDAEGIYRTAKEMISREK